MMDFRVPAIALVSKYKVRGRVLVIPINGEGRANIRMGEWDRRGERTFVSRFIFISTFLLRQRAA